MSSTTCNVTGAGAIDPASLLFKPEPFSLQSNKFLTFVYPTMQTDGSEPEIQIGADDQHGIVVTSFNGKDFDTKAPRPEQRKLHVNLDGEYTNFFEALDAQAKAAAKKHKGAWFPAQKNITDEDIDKIFVPTLRETAHGKELRCELMHTGKHAVKFFDRGDDGTITHGKAPWNNESETHPVRYEALMIVRYYIVITKRTNGKKYEKIHIKVWPSKVLKLRDAKAAGGGGSATYNPSLPILTTMASPTDISLTPPVVSEKVPHLRFCDVHVAGRDLEVNFGLFGGEHDTTSTALWPEMGASGGPPVAADVDVLDGAAGHARVIEAVERGVLDYVKTNRAGLGAAGRTDEDIEDMFKSCIREAASRTMVRFSLTGGAAPVVYAATNGEMKPAGPADLDVLEGEVPRRVQTIPCGVRFGVTLAYTDEGELDGISVKARARVLLVVTETVESMFIGVSRTVLTDAEPAAKRVRMSE